MKHAGSNDTLKSQVLDASLPDRDLLPDWRHPSSQSLTSKLILAGAGLFLLAVLADEPVRQLAQSFDPSTRAALRFVTGFGNSAWPLGIGLLLLGLVALLRRIESPARDQDLAAFRGMLILLVSSVAASGFLASLTKHIIGRIRPSMPEAEVLGFSFMAFQSGWAAFPSGHATTATAAAVAMALCFPRQAWGWLAIGLLSALTRALLGVHWLSDCLAGIALGAVVTIAIHRRMAASGFSHADAASALQGVWAAVVALLRLIYRRMARALRRAPMPPQRP